VNTEETVYKIKIILSLKKLLESGKKIQKEVKGNKITYSYHGVATNALLRKATINDTLNGHTSPKASTLVSIVEAMGFTMTDFGEQFDNICNKDVELYLKEHSNLR